jgi:hypothetical protein
VSESVISELLRFVSWCLFSFPVELIAERAFSLALCGWLKGQKGSPGLYLRRVLSDYKSVSLLRRLHVLPIPHVISFFFPLLFAVKTSSLELVFIFNQNRITLFVREIA